MKNKEAVLPVTGEELYRRFIDGDGGAFDELVSLYENELSSFIFSIVRDYHEAKHLTIETFAQLAVSSGKFAGKSSLKTYLFAIGKNLTMRHMKKRGREQHIPLEDAIETLVCEGETPHDFIEREEKVRLVHEAMRDLKDEYRVVLLLLYFEDMSYIDAARVMNKSVKQISDLAYRAKATLKKKLENENRFDY